MARSEPWFMPYDRPGRSGMVAQMSCMYGLNAQWWALHATQERARREAGLESEYDCDD